MCILHPVLLGCKFWDPNEPRQLSCQYRKTRHSTCIRKELTQLCLQSSLPLIVGAIWEQMEGLLKFFEPQRVERGNILLNVCFRIDVENVNMLFPNGIAAPGSLQARAMLRHGWNVQTHQYVCHILVCKGRLLNCSIILDEKRVFFFKHFKICLHCKTFVQTFWMGSKNFVQAFWVRGTF